MGTSPPAAPAPPVLSGVHLHDAPPPGVARGSVLLLHGLGDHTGRYPWASELFHRHGWRVVGLDWPGCGASRGRRGDLPPIEEAAALLEAALETLGSRPEGVLAHSTGAFYLVHFLARRLPCLSGLRWAWLSSPLVRPEAGQGRLKIALAKRAARLLPRLSVSTGVRPVDCRHRRPGERRLRFAEGCHNRITLRFGEELLRHPVLPSAAAAPPMPLLVTQGGEDAICSPHGALELFGALPSREKVFLYLGSARHEPFREPGVPGFRLGAAAWLRGRAEAGRYESHRQPLRGLPLRGGTK